MKGDLSLTKKRISDLKNGIEAIYSADRLYVANRTAPLPNS